MSITLFPNASSELQRSLGVFAELSDAFSPRLVHALGCAGELRRRVIVNRESTRKVAESLGVEWGQANGVVKILRYRFNISPERLAVIAMKDPGYEDADIAEIFGRSKRWAAVVRAQAEEIRADEYIPFSLEWPDPDLQPEDPTPEQIAERAAELRAQTTRVTGRGAATSGIRTYRWSGNRGSTLQPSVA